MGDTMKKMIILAIILLIATGCSCEYNLKIENNTYSEEVILTANTVSESNNFNNTWSIPVDKNLYNIGLDTESNGVEYGTLYDSKLSGSRLTFSHSFNSNDFTKSTAVSKCYNTLSISRSNGNTIISTGKEAKCFDDNPDLNSVIINITVDNTVVKNNADSKSGNTYTWKINKNNASNKPINLIIKDSNDITNYVTPTSTKDTNIYNTEGKNDYSTYILAGILGLLALIGYAIFTKMKNKEEKI